MCFKAATEKTKQSQEIDDFMRKERKEASNRVKLLLLGTGESGKSTFIKQMKVSYMDGFSPAEKTKFQSILQENTLSAMKRMLEHPESQVDKTLIKEKNDVLASTELVKCVDSLIRIWQDETFRVFFEQRDEKKIQVPTSTDYFFDNAKRFAEPTFLPTADDMMRARLKTTGISEIVFHLAGIEFTLVDVGGQRSERRKWLHVFENVSSIIFLAALDEYDKTLEEDVNVNRMDESLRLFSEVTGSQYFQPASWILFLNKSDLFEEKIKRKPLQDYFKDVTEKEGRSFHDAVQFIQKKYQSNFKGHRLYPFVTCAIDTKNCQRVFQSVRDSIMSNTMNARGGDVI